MTSALERLAELHGVADTYRDWRDQPREVSLESRAAILAALGVDASDEQAAQRALDQHETMRWTRMAPPVIVIRIGEPLVAPLAVPDDLNAIAISCILVQDDCAARACVTQP